MFFFDEVMFFLHIEMKHKFLKKSIRTKWTVQKMPSFFFLSFSFNLRFLYKLKYTIGLSKIMCRIFHYRFCFVFIKVYIFVQQKCVESPFEGKLQNYETSFIQRVIKCYFLIPTRTCLLLMWKKLTSTLAW